MKKQNFIIGALFLTLASFFAKIIGAIYRIPLTNILGAEGLGLYQLIFPLYSVILVFCSTGVPNAIAKIIATKDNDDCKTVLKLSLIFFTLLSIVFSIILILFSKQIAIMQGNSDIAIVYLGIAPAIIFVGILSVFRGFFQGKQNIVPTSLSLIVEQTFKLLFGLLFSKLLINKGVVYGALGAVIGVTISELFALIIIFIEFIFYYKKNLVITSKHKSNIRISNILKIALPITFSSMIMPITLLIDSFLIVNLLKHIGYSVQDATNLYGILTGVVNSLINLPVVLSMSIATMAIPIISKLQYENKFVEVSQKSCTAFTLVLLIAIPCVIIFYFFSYDIITFLFRNGLKIGSINEFEVASKLLSIGSFSILFIAIVQISTTILQAINLSKIPIISLFIGCSIKIILTIVLVLIPNVNIYGAIISSLVCYLICSIINVGVLLKKVKIKLSYRYDIILPIIASVMMATTMRLVKYLLSNSVLVVPFMFVCGGIIYLLVYAIMTYGEKYNIQQIYEFTNRIIRKKDI